VSDFPILEGDMVRVMARPFASFNGVVEDVDEARSLLKVAVWIFGRVCQGRSPV